MSYWYHSGQFVVQHMDGLLCENSMYTAYTYSQHLEIQGRVRNPWANAYYQPAFQHSKTKTYANSKVKFTQPPDPPPASKTGMRESIVTGNGLRGPFQSAKQAQARVERDARKREPDKPVLCVLVQCEGEEFWAPWAEASINSRWVIINERKRVR